ncbi:MAG TPA: hypothetical protein DCW46_04695 [Desulfotomaculum sp.]|nr:hypothetical protein [Desulfotomaculum sp.]HAU31557.1 hypothetical protein [Desulfotomaculum sp.]
MGCPVNENKMRVSFHPDQRILLRSI